MLKKELARTQFEQKDNVRIQKIQRLEKDIEMMELGMNALRKSIGDEDICDKAITAELKKGPQRVRIASREEMKIDINKYKNISLRLMQEIKAKGLKPGTYATKANLAEKETGLRPDEKVDNGALTHLEQMSMASNLDDMGGSEMGDSVNADAE